LITFPLDNLAFQKIILTNEETTIFDCALERSYYCHCAAGSGAGKKAMVSKTNGGNKRIDVKGYGRHSFVMLTLGFNLNL
jgi:hypothetical protein